MPHIRSPFNINNRWSRGGLLRTDALMSLELDRLQRCFSRHWHDLPANYGSDVQLRPAYWAGWPADAASANWLYLAWTVRISRPLIRLDLV